MKKEDGIKMLRDWEERLHMELSEFPEIHTDTISVYEFKQLLWILRNIFEGN